MHTDSVPAQLNPDDAAAFARISLDLAREPDTEQTVQRVVELAQASIPGCDYAGFTLTHKDALETAAATDPVIGRLDQAQHDLNEGPCLSAAKTDETYLVRDTTKEQRWPRWCAAAAANGVMSVLSVQLTGPGPGSLRAAMNLYSKTIDAYDDDAVITAQIYAAHAGTAIAAVNKHDNLQTAMQSRHTIGVAQGLLMQRYGITEQAAFQVLSRQSQEANIKLRDVARRLVELAIAEGGRLS
jgi:putative methionine-R-sulfoxide reductase with GAF domain